MTYLTDDQKRGLLANTRYRKQGPYGRWMHGKRIAFDVDHRGLGAVVVYPDGQREFFGVNPHNLRVISIGHPPKPTKRWR